MRRVRVKPHQLVIAASVLAALVFAGSGIVPSITEWHDDSPVSREVFGNVPAPLQAVFYTLMATMCLLVGWMAAMRVKNWERGRPDDRSLRRDNAGRRARDYRAGVWMRTLFRDAPAGAMHSMIYFGFIVLFMATVILEIDHQVPEDLKFLHGDTYRAYAFTADLFGVIFVVGILWAIVRRYVQRPKRIRTKTKPEDALVLGTFLLIGVSGFFVEGLRIAHAGAGSSEPVRSSSSGRSSDGRSPSGSATSARAPSPTSTVGSGRCTSWRSSGSPSCCPPRSSGTWSPRR